MTDILSLLKLRISLLSAGLSVVGMILAGGRPAPVLLELFVGFFFMAGGASALNHVQDCEIDRRMARTRNRPVSSGRWSVRGGTVFSLFCIGWGAVLLGMTFPPGVAVLAFAAVLTYNGIYAWLRRRTWAAVFVGALSGVFPVAAGWLAGEGRLVDPGFLAMAVFAYAWQVPHFWLLSLRYGQEYEAAGVPTPSIQLGYRQVGRIAFSWVLGLAGLSLCLPLFGLLHAGLLTVLLSALSVLLVLKAVPLLHPTSVAEAAASAFPHVTGHVLAILGILGLASVLTPVRF